MADEWMQMLGKTLKKRTQLQECPFCKEKPNTHVPNNFGIGNPEGDGSLLGVNEMEFYWAEYPKMEQALDHPFSFSAKYNKNTLDRPLGVILKPGEANDFTFPLLKRKKGYKAWTAQAHHLISSVCMKYATGSRDKQKTLDEQWVKLCFTFGYDINRAENGIILPCYPPLACKLKVPLHLGNHSKTITNIVDSDDGVNSTPINHPSTVPDGTAWKNYVKAVRDEIAPLKEDPDDFCSLGKNAAKQFIEEMNKKSHKIWGYVKDFLWTITKDGKDYQLGNAIGCCSYVKNGKIEHNRTIGQKFKAKEAGNATCGIKGIIETESTVGQETGNFRDHGELITYRSENRDGTRKRYDANIPWVFKDDKDGSTTHPPEDEGS